MVVVGVGLVMVGLGIAVVLPQPVLAAVVVEADILLVELVQSGPVLHLEENVSEHDLVVHIASALAEEMGH